MSGATSAGPPSRLPTHPTAPRPRRIAPRVPAPPLTRPPSLARSNKRLRSVMIEDLPIRKAAFVGERGLVLACGRRKHFYLYDVESGKPLRVPYLRGQEQHESLETFVASAGSEGERSVLRRAACLKWSRVAPLTPPPSPTPPPPACVSRGVPGRRRAHPPVQPALSRHDRHAEDERQRAQRRFLARRRAPAHQRRRRHG